MLGLLLALIAATALSPRITCGQMPTMQDIVPGAELDIGTNELIRVATSYADALRELRTAQLSAKTLRSLQPNPKITRLEIQIADVNLAAAESKVRILRAMAEKLLLIAKAKLELLKQVEQTTRGVLGRTEPPGQSTPDNLAETKVSARYAQARFRVEILEMILQME